MRVPQCPHIAAARQCGVNKIKPLRGFHPRLGSPVVLVVSFRLPLDRDVRAFLLLVEVAEVGKLSSY